LSGRGHEANVRRARLRLRDVLQRKGAGEEGEWRRAGHHGAETDRDERYGEARFESVWWIDRAQRGGIECSPHLLESRHVEQQLQTMFQRDSGPRLPLKAALKVYWPWMLPLVLCSAVIFFVPNAAAHFLVVSVLFVVSAASAAWPWFRHDAPYSFWMVAVGLWLCTGLIFPVIAGLVAELWK